ncbi:MAG: hypothetical protein B6D41_06875 [Chloroflexi bacterium UTCFX4]|jgi:uncharacterized protein with PQ loop repeat|nr:MAG: hypothetical protein B6D41_06875 [Chloroflexi bacterium UTCFX4]
MNNGMQFLGVVLILVNIVCAFSLSAQIRLTYQRKNTVGVSWVPYTMGFINAFVGLLYSLFIADLPFIIANLVWSLVNGIMVFLLFHYRRRANTNRTAL